MQQPISELTSPAEVRRFHAYCIGAAKTGTTTVADMFRTGYASDHEPKTRRTTHVIIQYLENQISLRELRQMLRKRDQTLNLEMEASHFLVYVSRVLCRMFPQARFVITIREPLAWLRSRLSFHLQADAPAWEQYRNYFWAARHQEWAAPEKALQELGVFSLDTYLSQYADHYRRAFAEIPANRRLVIRTDKLSDSPAALAGFLDIPEETLSITHSKKGKYPISIIEQLDSGFVRDRIRAHCMPLIEEFFPELIDNYR